MNESSNDLNQKIADICDREDLLEPNRHSDTKIVCTVRDGFMYTTTTKTWDYWLLLPESPIQAEQP